MQTIAGDSGGALSEFLFVESDEPFGVVAPLVMIEGSAPRASAHLETEVPITVAGQKLFLQRRCIAGGNDEPFHAVLDQAWNATMVCADDILPLRND